MKKRGYDGVRVLTVYTIFLALAYLMFAITNQTTMFFGAVIEGTAAVALNFIFLVLIATVIVGLIKKLHFAWHIAVGWFSFEILNSIVSMYIQFDLYTIIHDVILAAFAFIILIDALILWYLFEIKKYFFNKKHNKEYDTFFIRALSALMIIAIIVTFAFTSYHFLNVTAKTDKTISELRLKTYSQAKEVCEGKTKIDKDVCYLTVAAIYEQAYYDVCENIDSTFYKFSCIRAIK